MKHEDILRRMKDGIVVGVEIPKTRGGSRPVTRIIDDRIYMRTGVETKAEKYVTSEMILFAYESINTGFNSDMLANQFPQEFSQETCVFSMTGGIIVTLGLVRCFRRGNRYIYVLARVLLINIEPNGNL